MRIKRLHRSGNPNRQQKTGTFPNSDNRKIFRMSLQSSIVLQNFSMMQKNFLPRKKTLLTLMKSPLFMMRQNSKQKKKTELRKKKCRNALLKKKQNLSAKKHSRQQRKIISNYFCRAGISARFFIFKLSFVGCGIFDAPFL